MAAKFMLIVFAAVLSVALAMPAAPVKEAEPKETMESAESIHIGIGVAGGYAAGYYPRYYGGYGHGYRRGYGLPYYGPFDYTGFLPAFMHY